MSPRHVLHCSGSAKRQCVVSSWLLVAREFLPDDGASVARGTGFVFHCRVQCLRVVSVVVDMLVVFLRRALLV